MSVTELPTELWLHIGEFVVEIDSWYRLLSSLAQTCRRLYGIFEPQIDAHHVKCIVASKAKFTRLDRDEFECCPANPILGQVRELSIHIGKENQTLDAVRCFRHLIARAKTIEAVKVDVDDFNPQVLVCLLNSCVQRPQLRLEVNGDSHHEQGPFIFEFDTTTTTATCQQRDVPQIEQPSAKSAMVLTKLKELFFWTKEKNVIKNFEEKTLYDMTPVPLYTVTPRRPDYTGLPYPQFPPLLTSLCIKGDHLFSASMYPWMLYILNMAPLTHLSITNGPLNHFIWSQMLSAITIPTLKGLGIGKIAVAFPDLVEFLKRHPSIEKLDLTSNLLIGVFRFPKSLSKSEFLPRLCSLTATSEYTRPFIQYHQLGYCPLLKTYEFVSIPGPSFRWVFESQASRWSHKPIEQKQKEKTLNRNGYRAFAPLSYLAGSSFPICLFLPVESESRVCATTRDMNLKNSKASIDDRPKG